jgi:hypothetical protein
MNADAERVIEQTLQRRLAVLGPDNADTLMSINSLAAVLMQRNEPARQPEARALLERA